MTVLKYFDFIILVCCLFAMISADSSANTNSKAIDRNQNGVIDEYEDPSATIEKRVNDLLSRMTLAEKVGQMQQLWQLDLMNESCMFSKEKAIELVDRQGIGSFLRVPCQLTPQDQASVISKIQKIAFDSRLGIPVLFGQNACYGYADMYGASVFPGGIAMACTWRPELLFETAKATAYECSAVGVYWNYAPILGIARDPRWGRIGETLGEDPVLASVMAYHQIRGYQAPSFDHHHTIMATPKHYAANSVPKGGINHGGVDMSDKALREVFLPPFRAAAFADAGSFMAAHNEINGIPCHCNSALLTDILRGEFGFNGVMISDYSDVERIFSVFNLASSVQEAGKLALEAGIDVDMVGSWEGEPAFGQSFIRDVNSGKVSDVDVNRAAGNLLRMKFKLGLFDRSLNIDPVKAKKQVAESQTQHRQLALRAARESMVLLKNRNATLPLNIENLQSIAVLGPNADSRNALFAMKYNNPETPMPTVLAGIRKKIKNNAEIYFEKGCNSLDSSRADFEAAFQAAQQSDVAIIVVGETAVTDETVQEVADMKASVGEEVDRARLGLPGIQQKFVEYIHKTGTPLVVVLLNGRPLAIEWIAEHADAIIEAWGPGEEGGNAVADVLFGDYNPGGKLTVTFPRTAGQLPVHYNHLRFRKPKHDYVETQKSPLYVFGHGLSYTTFNYSNLIMSKNIDASKPLTCQFKLKNTGKYRGDEVMQVYLKDKIASIARPVKELKAFKRVTLEPGEEVTLSISIPVEMLAFYDINHAYVIEPGEFEFMIGSSSEDIRLKQSFFIEGKKRKVDYSKTYFPKVKVNHTTKANFHENK
ncbi:MAG: glycoside hydrolase family 3 N-terminal domain-containing protein [candidate division KSB1 bacterium]|nr:glycoside hydrolase family 3 N-terminal domain-containing protein [candidate division KSB1 bacterium]